MSVKPQETLEPQTAYARFQALAQLLLQHQPLWRLQPFHVTGLPWATAYPALAAYVAGLSEAHCEALDAAPDQLQAELGPLVATLDWPALCAVAELPLAPLQPPALLSRDIPGRKWQQITAFAAALAPGCGPVVDWCGGKGHLGRVLAWHGCGPVTTLEWQPELCRAGEQLAHKFALNQRFVCADALAAASAQQLHGSQAAVALHACGDLHRQLLLAAVASRVPAVLLAPCCYQLFAGEYYPPLSSHWPAALQLTAAEVRLAVQEQVTGGERIARLRRQQRLYRLAFDRWQRQARGQDCYLPLASAPGSLIGEDFAVFAEWAAASKGLVFKASAALCQQLLAAADADLVRIARLELVRHLFRRPLEMLLLLDQALLLQNAGYRVSLLRFCQRRVSPRNLLLSARLASS